MVRERIARGAVAEPLMRPGPRRDWTARVRGTGLDALRYSRFVGLMKRALPIAAAAVVVSVIVYSLIPRQPDRVTVSFQSMGSIDNDLAMIKPRLSGTDDDGNPFVITAAAAIQDPAHLHHVRLQKVEADMTLTDGGWINVTSKEGFFDMEVGTLKLAGGISFFSDSGYELHTAKVDINLKKGLFHGPGVVTGHGPLGSLKADRFDLDRLKQLLHLSGNVHMNFDLRGKHGS